MRDYRFYFVLFSIVLVITACSSSNWPDDYDVDNFNALRAQLEIDAKEITLSGDGEMPKMLSIKSNCPWTLSLLNASWLWCSDSPSGTRYQGWYGENNENLYIGAWPNSSFTGSRSTVVSIDCEIIKHDIKITQEPLSETLSVSQEVIEAGYSGNSYYVDVTSNGEWTVSSDADWCTASISGNSVRIYVYDNNSYATRMASVTVNGNTLSQTIQVNQAAPTEPSIWGFSISNLSKTSAEATFSYNSSDLYLSRYGVCYSKNEKEPTISNGYAISYWTSAKSRSNLTMTFTGLAENTSYYVRPFVETAAGITYGSTSQFTTLKANSPNEEDNPTPNY